MTPPAAVWLEGLGSVLKQAIRNPAFDPRTQPDFGPEHQVLWSRVGHQTSVLELITSSSLPAERAIAALRDLDRWNAIILVESGEPEDAPEAVPRPVTDQFTAPTTDEMRLLVEQVDLDDAQKRRVLALVRMLRQGRHYEMLGVVQGCSTRELKRAYFALSKEVHPDRYYGKRLGSFAPLLSMIFETACQAVKTLSDARTVAGGGAKPPTARRRVTSRYPFMATVKLRCASWPEVRRLITQDISTGGMFVPTEAEARAGERVEVELTLPSMGLLPVGGTVVERVSARDGEPAGLCIRLDPLSESDQARFEQLLVAAKEDAPVAAEAVGVQAGAPQLGKVRLARGSQTMPTFPKPIIGIDFGTTYLSVSAAVGNRVHILPWPDGSRAVPSVISFPNRKDTIVGAQARDRLLRDPRHTIPSIKRLLGRRSDEREIDGHLAQAAYEVTHGPDGNLALKMWDQTYAVPQICSYLIAAAREAAEKALGEQVDQAVMTVPVSFTPERIELLRRACKLAHVDVVEMIDEPTSAALANRFRPEFGGVVGIYDFGGGTFDFSLVDVSGGDFKVLATAGDSWLGGDDLDLAVAEAVANQFWRIHGVDLRQRQVEWQELVFACERAKRELSRGDAATLFIPQVAHTSKGPLDLKARVARSLAERIWQPIIDRSFHTCLQTLALVGLQPQGLSAIYLSGGSTYVPAVREGLAKRFGVPVRTGVPPDHAVCLGAGIHAAQLHRRRTPSIAARG
ncbi:MAG TPA: Hsp70 family protein [Kofleriaceae bacterium]|nr:Hsp70 family protein [Kofleriaceae bacterium]